MWARKRDRGMEAREMDGSEDGKGGIHDAAWYFKYTYHNVEGEGFERWVRIGSWGTGSLLSQMVGQKMGGTSLTQSDLHGVPCKDPISGGKGEHSA